MGKSAQIGFHVWLADAMEGYYSDCWLWANALTSPDQRLLGPP